VRNYIDCPGIRGNVYTVDSTMCGAKGEQADYFEPTKKLTPAEHTVALNAVLDKVFKYLDQKSGAFEYPTYAKEQRLSKIMELLNAELKRTEQGRYNGILAGYHYAELFSFDWKLLNK